MRHYQITTHALELSDAFGLLYPYEVMALQALARSLPPGAAVVNIGAGTGTSSLALVEARPDVQIYTVDISTGSPIGGLENERNAFAKTDLPLPVQILGDSKEIGRVWPVDGAPALLDLVFVDGDHSYDGCIADITAWLPHVKAGGYMAFHDYGRDVWPEVKPAVDDVMSVHTQILHVDTLAIYRIGDP